MGDVHIPQPPPNRVGAKVDELVASGHELYATAITGDPGGRVRRPTLFIVAGAGVVGALLGWQLAGIIALIAILILALTDQVVAL